MELSQLHMHSLGLVSRVKEFGTSEIKVIPIEVRLAAQEEIVASTYEQTAAFATHDGEDNIKVSTDNSVVADWLNTNSNRTTAPDVRRGDLVMIYRLGNTETYFWMDYNNKNVKRLETVVYAFSADANNPLNKDLSNAYFLEISTHNKAITLRTSQANGEPFGYEIQLNTDQGSFVIVDTAGNTAWIDSANTCIGAVNANGTSLMLDKKNINMVAPDSISVKANNTISLVCKDFSLTAKESVTVNTKTVDITSSDSITFQCNKFQSTSSTNVYTCPDTTFTGLVKAAGVSVVPGAGGAGACDIQGPLTAKVVSAEVLQVAGAITCGSITSQSANFQALTHGGGKCC